MTQIREYILGIVAAAILCSIVIQLTKDKSANAAVIKTACGIVMTICVVSPLVQFRLQSFSLPDLNAFGEVEQYVNEGYNASLTKISDVIKQRSEAYILEKATSFDCDLEVCVSVSGDDPPKPATITVSGNVSPAVRQKLQGIIERDLGVPTECQIWN